MSENPTRRATSLYFCARKEQIPISCAGGIYVKSPRLDCHYGVYSVLSGLHARATLYFELLLKCAMSKRRNKSMPKKTRKRPEIRTATEEPPDAWFATPSELAEALDVTTRSLNGWARTKRFPKPSRGLYDLRVVLRWFRESLAEAKTSAKTQTARDRLDEIKAANAELDFLARAGRLVWRRDVIAIWQRHITTARVLIENLGEWVVNQLPDDARAGLLDGIRAQIRVATQTLEAGKNLSEASAHPDKEAIEEDDDEED